MYFHAMKRTVAVGSLFIECNHLGGIPADLESFRRSGIFAGRELFSQTAGTVGGVLRTLQSHSVDIQPLLSASACPSGPLTLECYQFLKQETLQRLQAVQPVDG